MYEEIKFKFSFNYYLALASGANAAFEGGILSRRFVVELQ